MRVDIRDEAARFYDFNPDTIDDIQFYRDRIPNLIYRRYHGDDLIEEVTLEILMRCYYPDEFEEVIVKHGFEIINRWGGYSGESYGVGPELVIQFGG